MGQVLTSKEKRYWRRQQAWKSSKESWLHCIILNGKSLASSLFYLSMTTSRVEESEPKGYEIVFKMEFDIHNMDEDTATLFDNFSLLSWLSLEYKVRILSYRYSPEGIPYYVAKARRNKYELNRYINIFLYEYQKNPQTGAIVYFIQDHEKPIDNKYQIFVQFKKQTDKLVVSINDKSGYFQQIFDMPEQERFVRVRKQRFGNILEYRYIEPEDQRSQYEMEKDHFHLAFQGGGAKGVAYIGAYKAIKDLYPKATIRSIIGSSAGGMIALAVSAGATQEQLIQICKSMDKIPQDRTIKDMSELTPQAIQKYDIIKAKIRQFLHDHGLISTKIYDLLTDNVFDDDVIDKMFDMITGDNDSLKMMFSLEKQRPVYEKKCCSSPVFKGVEKRNLLVNYYGLIGGNLLKGNAVIDICKMILGKLITLRFHNDKDVFFKTFNMKPNYVINIDTQAPRLAEIMNMRQYYTLTKGVEFTCTSVDLESKILRFLNHKTTPTLPVCKAVQMTSAFPVAFQALRWKKEWGKYNIHYISTRREIDLTGHQFTDGGMLANFPIKFLDNENIRAFYFNHAQSQRTRIFGFGLKEIDEDPTEDVVRQKQLTQEELSDMVSARMPIMKLIRTQLFQTPKPQYLANEEMTDGKKLPLIEFLRKLANTYLAASQNFVMECFAKRFFLFKETLPVGKYMAHTISTQTLCEGIMALRQSLANLYTEMMSIDYSHAQLSRYITGHKFDDKGKKNLQSLVYVKSILVKNLKDYGLFRINLKKLTKHVQNVNPDYQSELDILESGFNQMLNKSKLINRYKVFTRSDSLDEDYFKFDKLFREWDDLHVNAGMKHPGLRQAVMEHLDSFYKWTKRDDGAIIEGLIHDLDCKIESVVNISKQGFINQRNNELIQSLARFAKYFTYKSVKTFKPFIDALEALDENTLKQQKEFQAKRSEVYDYIETTVMSNPSPRLHLVFQSQGVMSKYYLNTFKLINEFIFMNEGKKTKYLVDRITNRIIKSNQREDPNRFFSYTDLFFYIVTKSDLHKYVQKNLQNLPDIIDLGYTKYYIEPQLAITIRQKIEKRKADICEVTNITCSSTNGYMFFLLKAGLNSSRILREMDKIKMYFNINFLDMEREFYNMDWIMLFDTKVRNYQDIIWKSRFDIFQSMEHYARANQLEVNLEGIKREFENSRDYVLDSFDTLMEYVIDCDIEANTRSKDVSYEEFMAKKMSFKYGDKDYKEINEKIGIETRKVMQTMYSQYYHLIRHIILTYASQTNLELIAHQLDPVKRQALWKGIIMTNFIQADRFKSHIQDILVELNLPKDIKIKEFHEVCPTKIDLTFTTVDINSHVIEFINRHTYPEMPIWAAVLITASFPSLMKPIRGKPAWSEKIDVNSEKRFLKRVFDQGSQQQPVLVSGNLLANFPLEYVTNKKIQELYFNNAGKSNTFLSFGCSNKPKNYIIDRLFYRKFLSTSKALQFFFSNFQYVETGLFAQGRGDQLQSYVDGQDNLTLQIYYKQLISLPIRLGTLDFHKFKNPEVLPNIVEQTYYYTIEKFCSDNITFFKTILKNNILKFSFISKEFKTMDLMRKYKIQFRTEMTPFYKDVENNQIQLTHMRRLLFLKFIYVGEKVYVEKISKRITIFETEFRFDISGFAMFEYYEALYGFQYGTAINGALQPLKTPFMVFRPGIQTPKGVPLVLVCKSIINLNKSGLYCELCCSPLVPKSQQLMALSMLVDDRCTKCEKLRGIKFVCSNKYGPCPARYCMRCCKQQVVFKAHHKIYCNFAHEYTFMNKSEFVLQSEQVAYSRCDICMEYTESYFYDKVCENTLCQPCSSEFMNS